MRTQISKVRRTATQDSLALKQDWALIDCRNIVREGDRVAQLVLERVRAPYHFRSLTLTIRQIYTPEIQVVEELEQSVRGAGGFGSTGEN